jgi:hypothetical protein
MATHDVCKFEPLVSFLNRTMNRVPCKAAVLEFLAYLVPLQARGEVVPLCYDLSQHLDVNEDLPEYSLLLGKCQTLDEACYLLFYIVRAINVKALRFDF